MSFRVRLTPEALDDLERLHDYLVERSDGNRALAERALAAIRAGFALLEASPFSCRKAVADDTFLRELLIAFGTSGYVALFEIEDANTVTILAVRHQREDDYH